MLDALCSDAELQRRWSDLQLAGDALRSTEVAACHVDGFCDRVRKSLANEPTVLAPRRLARPAWRRYSLARPGGRRIGGRPRLRRRSADAGAVARRDGAEATSGDCARRRLDGRTRLEPGRSEGRGRHRERASARPLLRSASRTHRRLSAAARRGVPAARCRGALMVVGGLTREGLRSLRTSRRWIGALVVAASAWMPLQGSAQDARRDVPRNEAQWIQAARTAALRVNYTGTIIYQAGGEMSFVADHAHVRWLEVARAHPDARRQAARVPAQALRQRRRSAVPDSGGEEDRRREAQCRGLVSRR